MKKILFFLFVSTLLLTSIVGYCMDMNTKLMGKLIVIDVGHGGKDSGASIDGILEKDLNLIIALKLREELVKNGVDVILTRDGDYDLSSPNIKRRKKSDFDNRINLINASKADMYISIHMNYLNESKYYGAQVFYTEGNEILASSIQNMFIKNLNSPLKEKKLDKSIYMYEKLEIPGVLIECGFLSNKKERNKLLNEEYQDKLVESIVKGIILYY